MKLLSGLTSIFKCIGVCPRVDTLLAALLATLTALPATAQELVITFGGDVNFAQSRVTPSPTTVRKYGVYPLEFTTDYIRREFDGDINFINVETVVSDRNGSILGKQFVFRSHPDSFRHLMDLGVNAFALANNHAYDHGWQGMSDTLAFFEGEDSPENPLLFAGVGMGTDATAPRIATYNGIRVAMSAIGIGPAGFASGEARVGMSILSAPGHTAAVLQGLRDADADIRILSIHTGTENQMTLDWGQQALFRRAVEEAGVNLVLGHHPHIARGVEAWPEEGAAIFYSLGNFLFVGGAVRDGLPLGQDYGLMGTAYFNVTHEGVQLSALEALPLRRVHLAPEPFGQNRAAATIGHLSRLSTQTSGARGVTFTPLGDRGLACFGGPYGARAQALCCEISPTLQCDFPDLM